MIKHNCDTCEFFFYGAICAAGTPLPDGRDTYGMAIDEVKKFFPDGCENWEMSFELYQSLDEE